MIRNNLVAILTLAATGMAHGATDTSKPGVLVRILDTGPISLLNFQRAKEVATNIFDTAGVRLHWETPQSAAGTEPRNGGCANQEARWTIDIRFLYSTPESRLPGAAAEALPFAKSGIRITVFMDRVSAIMATRPKSGAQIFGHVLAHEIGHVLLRETSHAESGLMKAQWSHDDYSDMAVKNLGFTPRHAAMIRSNLSPACPPVAGTTAANQ